MNQESFLIETDAFFSKCYKYRYGLTRIWDDEKDFALFIGLNPSTADEINDDPTIRRCVNYARDWGYGGLYMANLFAYRATNPDEMKAAQDPIGPENDRVIKEASEKTAIVIAAWGVHGGHMDRDQQVLELLSDVYCLGCTDGGYPKHPLYLKKDQKPIKYREGGY